MLTDKDALVVDVIMPALNEADALPFILQPLVDFMKGDRPLTRSTAYIRRVLVVDNGSEDHTAQVARKWGAEVVYESQRGYGYACLAGIRALSKDPPQVVLFIDADGSDDLSDLDDLLALLNVSSQNELTSEFERFALNTNGIPSLVIGSRAKLAEEGALTPLQRFGNALSCRLLKIIFGAKFTDLGPFRAIRWEALMLIHMSDPTYGWTVEMQAKVCAHHLTALERDVHYYPRQAGDSKISGTLKGSVKAGIKILWTIAKAWWMR